MDFTAIDHRSLAANSPADGMPGIVKTQAHISAPEHKQRSQRYSLLIRSAKLVGPNGEFVCVVRDVSQTGVRLRFFHEPPRGDPLELHMTNGSAYELRQVWQEGCEAGYEFAQAIELSAFLAEPSNYPKRPLRLGLFLPIQVNSLTGTDAGTIDNLSQQGACFSCERLYAIDQNLRVECLEQEACFAETRAKVRWRRESAYGVVFDNTLSLEELARLAARIQCPDLLR